MMRDAGWEILDKARELGADAAGIASVEQLRGSPSHQLLARFGTKIDGEYAFDEARDLTQVTWPLEARSAVVVAVSHGREQPELDWSWPSGNTPGNRRLIQIAGVLATWMEEWLGLGTRRMPYWVEEGGVYLKDAAVLAGLGVVGRNNLVISPKDGPRLRFRAVLIDAELGQTGPLEFDPCRGCGEPCRDVCREQAFGRAVLTAAEAGIATLPGRDGTYGRAACFVQMGRDMEDSGVEPDEEFMIDSHVTAPVDEAVRETARIKWCRRCELACPVGQ